MKVVFESCDIARDYRKATNARVKKTLIIFSAVFLLLGGASLVAGIIKENESLINLGATLLIFIAVYILLMLLLIKFAAKRQIKTNKMAFGGSMRAVFEDDVFYTFTENEMCKDTTESKYEGIYRVFEFKEVVTVMTSNMTAFMLNKNNVTEGSFDEFRDAMRQRIGVKYKLRTKI
ncbi:MAG: YcxB family protein [Clostridiales bacterium]|jgi:hypothetical protein|nr:YcxB family protein [Clostridiales bacterium]